ncbi:MAG: hypothetical protein CR994_02265 [Maribacter sp.]|nr:MAG: hypothetical protein CR994_02265 [Maribacter sp.]
MPLVLFLVFTDVVVRARIRQAIGGFLKTSIPKIPFWRSNFTGRGFQQVFKIRIWTPKGSESWKQ